MTYLTNGNNKKAIIQKSNQLSVEIRIIGNTMARNIIKVKKRSLLCHIGLVKDHGGHLVNQCRLLNTDRC